jgi:hypothetical protein
MPSPRPSSLETDIAAALDWWREAGVDAAFADEPSGWLAEPSSAQAPAASPPAQPEPVAAPPPRIGGLSSDWPNDLATFRDWWLSEPSLDEGGLTPRIAPTGDIEAELMVLVSMPEEQDSIALLGGPQGRLLGGFLAAAGIASDAVYRASVLARHTALPDWKGLASGGLSQMLQHHVALARPKRLLVLGNNILPLCGHDPAQGSAAFTFFNHEGGRVPALAEAGLERLLGNAQLRARLWKRWLDWTDG